MTSALDPVHLQRLKGSADPVDWIADSPFNWASRVCPDDATSLEQHLPRDRLTRSELSAYCADKSRPVESIFLAIMAWGGMRRDHGRRTWAKRRDGLLDLLGELRRSGHSPASGYEKFLMLRAGQAIPGLGPAYFTKLLFFLNPQDQGSYIMDQWTSKSVNLLFGPTIHLTIGQTRNQDSVSWKNTSAIYADFCVKIDLLAKALECGPGGEAERLLFSQKRPTPHHWRHYVRQIWDPRIHNAA